MIFNSDLKIFKGTVFERYFTQEKIDKHISVHGSKAINCVLGIMQKALQQTTSTDNIKHSRWLVYTRSKETILDAWMDMLPSPICEASFGTSTISVNWLGHNGMPDIDLSVIVMSPDSESDIKKMICVEFTAAWINEDDNIDEDNLCRIVCRIGRFPHMMSVNRKPFWNGIIIDTLQTKPIPQIWNSLIFLTEDIGDE